MDARSCAMHLTNTYGRTITRSLFSRRTFSFGHSNITGQEDDKLEGFNLSFLLVAGPS